MAGRKPLPTAVKRLQGATTPLNPNEPTPALGHPSRPAHIKGEAQKEWDRICEELDGMGLLTTADRTVIAMYCQAWMRWANAEEQITKLGGDLVAAPKTKTPMHNPWLSVSNKAFEQMRQMLTELGLTPSARSRFKVTKEEPPTDLDEFL